MTTQLDLRKKVELVLTKKGFSENIRARVGLVIDESGSMGGMFRDGTVSDIVDRALTVGYKFDDNGEIDVWSFSHKVARRNAAKQDDFGSYIKHSMLGGSTLYHPVLADAANFYFQPKVKTSLFGFRKSVEAATTEPAFIIFITDGYPDNNDEALQEVSKILHNNPNLFVQFVGIGMTRFPILEEIAASNANAALSIIESGDNDEVIFDKFLNEKARKILEV